MYVDANRSKRTGTPLHLLFHFTFTITISFEMQSYLHLHVQVPTPISTLTLTNCDCDYSYIYHYNNNSIYKAITSTPTLASILTCTLSGYDTLHSVKNLKKTGSTDPCHIFWTAFD